MNRRLSFLAPLVVVFLIASSLDVRAEVRAIRRNTEGRKVALVIGNGGYETSPLKNPVNDARDMSAALKGFGFEVIHKENATKKEMLDALSQFSGKLSGATAGLIFFAGHGMQVDGRNYLIPVNSRVESESDVEFEAVNAGRMLAKMEDARCETNIIILDACRNNPFARSFRSSGQGLAKMDAPLGSIIAYSTAPGGVAADGSGRNSVFTKHLLKNMLRSGDNISDIFMNTRNDVLRETGEKQAPWESTSLRGHFFFSAQGGDAPKVSSPPKPEPVQVASIDPMAPVADAPAVPLKAESAGLSEQELLPLLRGEWALRQQVEPGYRRYIKVRIKGENSIESVWWRYQSHYIRGTSNRRGEADNLRVLPNGISFKTKKYQIEILYKSGKSYCSVEGLPIECEREQ